MTRYKAIISYDGTNFSGFQIQTKQNVRSIQGELEKVLKKLNSGNPVGVQGSGRTDARVHAIAQVIHFDLPQKRDEEKLRFALDTQGPDDIAVLEVEEVSDDFHVRYNKHEKTYEYLLDTSKARDPFKRNYAGHFRYDLNLSRMQEAAKYLIGEHDFTGFTASGTSVENKVRTITQADIEQIDENTIKFTFSGNGFLYKQIRNMVGTLLKIGNNRMPVEQVEKIIASKDRNLAGPTAVPEGLYLKEVRYVDEEVNGY
ncbi:tRNA pseudouridine(38-40) synthase TruA [Floricoccus penangensis]|uniref:tRNA pseudouridine synthase A n=1 Tax=Floricoccus penangensis TaxID=1859475 RepID=A0A9Q5JG68_9LACT|nr:tRNA pseudouridine(38-40) synthase TruA [Floricoccus penangensis]OFI46817.1 tRNA pseudouridine(38-40) synthase TruA [Floricoccus penangensis]